jgi:hypothetical protein
MNTLSYPNASLVRVCSVLSGPILHHNIPAMAAFSLLVRQKVINMVVPQSLAQFINDDTYIGKGFEIWGHLLKNYPPRWHHDHLHNIHEVLTLETGSSGIMGSVPSSSPLPRQPSSGEDGQRHDCSFCHIRDESLSLRRTLIICPTWQYDGHQRWLGPTQGYRRFHQCAKSSFEGPSVSSANRTHDKGGLGGEPHGHAQDKP